MIQYPKPLNKGAKIAIVSPAGAVEESQIVSTINLIRYRGFEPILSPHCLGRFDNNGYSYSGTEKERVSDLNWALNNDEFSAIWATRGGYGCQHLLRDLELSEFRQKPKWYIGYSDNTVIQSYLLRNNFVSIHGQTLKTPPSGVSEKSYEEIFSILEEGKSPNYGFQPHSLNKNGEVEGVLVGGNLTLIYALLATPYSFDFKDKILFLEDIGESFYSLDRMLTSLDLAGVFSKIKGIIIGGMTNMEDEKDNPNYNHSFDFVAYNIISQRLKKYNIPTIFAFPNGHIFDNRPLVLGAKVKMEVFDKEVNINFV